MITPLPSGAETSLIFTRSQLPVPLTAIAMSPAWKPVGLCTLYSVASTAALATNSAGVTSDFGVP